MTYFPDEDDHYSDDFEDWPAWTTPLFWTIAAALIIATLLFADTGKCYEGTFDRQVECPADTAD